MQKKLVWHLRHLPGKHIMGAGKHIALQQQAHMDLPR